MDRARVLVVEDEQNIRDLVCLHLGSKATSACRWPTAKRRCCWRARRLRSDHPRPDAAEHGRRHHHPRHPAPWAEPRRADPDADRAARRSRQSDGPRQRRRRLPDQAVRRARADGAGGRADAPRARRRWRPATATSRRSRFTASSSIRRAAACACAARRSMSRVRSSTCCTCSPRIRASCSRASACCRACGRSSRLSPAAASTRSSSGCGRRSKIDPADPQLILTVWGDGYKFADV